VERSGVIAGWKVRRELGRLGQQLRAIPEAVWEPVAQRRHNAACAAGLPVTEGAMPLAEKVAMLLIWQPKGVRNSVLATCRHLAAQGYAPFIVSNAPLSASDSAALAAVAWRVMVRPNFGYDFGGYRDGLRQLDRMGVAPERLVILNDSIWFPLYPDDDSLAQMEACGADLAGTVLRVRGAERFLESYFYSIPRSTLQHPAFRQFWDRLKLTSNKYKVIRRGERGFSAAMRAAGLQLAGIYTPDRFLEGVKAAEAQELRALLRYSASLNSGLVNKAALLVVEEGEAFAANARGVITEILAKGQFYSSFPVGAVRWMRYPVLKKSSDATAVVWRRAFVKAVEAGSIPRPSEAVYAEIQERVRGEVA
jgi:hypothetical protein